MIAWIGFMIGAYIFTRMCELCLTLAARKGHPEDGLLWTMASLTMLIVLAAIAGIFNLSAEAERTLGPAFRLN